MVLLARELYILQPKLWERVLVIVDVIDIMVTRIMGPGWSCWTALIQGMQGLYKKFAL